MSDTTTAGVLLATSDVARVIGRSPDRVRQLMRMGRLSPAVVTAAGQHLYTMAEAERVAAQIKAASR